MWAHEKSVIINNKLDSPALGFFFLSSHGKIKV